MHYIKTKRPVPKGFRPQPHGRLGCQLLDFRVSQINGLLSHCRQTLRQTARLVPDRLAQEISGSLFDLGQDDSVAFDLIVERINDV